jgi:hypothetical protein
MDLGLSGKTAVADMTTRDGVLNIVRAARERFGDPDILMVNSPGAVPDRATGRQVNAVKRAG